MEVITLSKQTLNSHHFNNDNVSDNNYDFISG